MTILADLSRIDVGVDDLGAGSEGVETPGDTVVEPSTDGDEEIGALQRPDGSHRAVHAGHAEGQRMCGR